MLRTLRQRWLSLTPTRQYAICGVSLLFFGFMMVIGVLCLNAYAAFPTPGLDTLGILLVILGGNGIFIELLLLLCLAIYLPRYYRDKHDDTSSVSS